jgi:RNA polymerase sigma-70 factor (ECF subfamily)
MAGLPSDGPEIPDLLAAAARGDEPAFARLVDFYYPHCLRCARNLLGERADAEDAVQDAFIRAHRALPAYEHRQRFGAWLYRIVLNCCRSRYAASRRARELTSAEVPAALSAPGSPWDGAWEQRLERGLAELPPAQREAFLLHYVEGLGYEEMAGVTGEGVSSLKMRVKRAKDRFTEFLRESGYV